MVPQIVSKVYILTIMKLSATLSSAFLAGTTSASLYGYSNLNHSCVLSMFDHVQLDARNSQYQIHNYSPAPHHSWQLMPLASTMLVAVRHMVVFF